MFNFNIFKYNYLDFFIIIFFTLFFILGFVILEDYGMPLDQLEYRQQGIIILTHLGNIFLPEYTRTITQNYDVVSIEKYQETFIFSASSFISTTNFCISACPDLDPIVLISLNIS